MNLIRAILDYYFSLDRLLGGLDKAIRKMERAKLYHEGRKEAMGKIIAKATTRLGKADKDAMRADAVAENLRKLLVK